MRTYVRESHIHEGVRGSTRTSSIQGSILRFVHFTAKQMNGSIIAGVRAGGGGPPPRSQEGPVSSVTGLQCASVWAGIGSGPPTNTKVQDAHVPYIKGYSDKYWNCVFLQLHQKILKSQRFALTGMA